MDKISVGFHFSEPRVLDKAASIICRDSSVIAIQEYDTELSFAALLFQKHSAAFSNSFSKTHPGESSICRNQTSFRFFCVYN
jgi:hypothetical protein